MHSAGGSAEALLSAPKHWKKKGRKATQNVLCRRQCRGKRVRHRRQKTKRSEEKRASKPPPKPSAPAPRKEEESRGKTDRAEGSAEAQVPVPKQNEGRGRFCEDLRSCRGECRGGPLRHRCSFLGPLKDATATRVSMGLFVILPLGTSPIYTH